MHARKKGNCFQRIAAYIGVFNNLWSVLHDGRVDRFFVFLGGRKSVEVICCREKRGDLCGVRLDEAEICVE